MQFLFKQTLELIEKVLTESLRSQMQDCIRYKKPT